MILQQPLNHIYLAATSAMALFNAIDSLDNITMTGTQASGWYIENAVKAMEDGKMKLPGNTVNRIMRCWWMKTVILPSNRP